MNSPDFVLCKLIPGKHSQYSFSLSASDKCRGNKRKMRGRWHFSLVEKRANKKKLHSFSSLVLNNMLNGQHSNSDAAVIVIFVTDFTS